jgi:hypothetical protein
MGTHRTNPHQIGQRPHPEVHETAQPFKNRPSRTEEVRKEYPSDGEVWTGEGYQTKQAVNRLAQRYLEVICE